MKLWCCLCLYVPIDEDKTARKAITIMDGHAVCEQHMGYMQSGLVSHYIVESRKKMAGA